MFINGEWVDSESKKTFETLNPENNEPWAVVPEASAKDVETTPLMLRKKHLREIGQNYFLKKEQNF